MLCSGTNHDTKAAAAALAAVASYDAAAAAAAASYNAHRDLATIASKGVGAAPDAEGAADMYEGGCVYIRFAED